MNTRLTRTLASATLLLAVLCGVAFIGTGVTHMIDDGAVCVQTDFWQLPWLLFGALALALFSRPLRAVLLQGPFTEVVAHRLSVLGWFVTAGTPLAGLIVGWSQSWLVGSMAPIVGSGPTVSGPLVLILAGLAAVIMGKIMREGVRMREDLEGTALTELSAQVGTTVVSLSVLKNGRARAIRLSTLSRICEVLRCQPGDLITHDFAEPTQSRPL